MKARVCFSLLLMASTGSLAGFGGMGNIEDGGGGSFTFKSLVAVLLFFGGIFWFMTRFEDEQRGFFWLMAAVLALIVAGWVSNCAG